MVKLILLSKAITGKIKRGYQYIGRTKFKKNLQIKQVGRLLDDGLQAVVHSLSSQLQDIKKKKRLTRKTL